MTIITIVGIDPSMRNTGIAKATLDLATLDWRVTSVHLAATEASKEGKVVRKSSDDLRRARVIVEALWKHTEGAAFAVAEVPSGTQSARGSFSNGLCCGALASLKVPLIEVNPTEVKIASAGHKYAAKEEIIEWAVAKFPNAGWLTRKVKGNLKLLNDNEHLADAVAAIAAGLETDYFKQLRSMTLSLKAA